MKPATRLILIPGFMSPAWMLYPMQLYLRGDFDHVVRWDYPRIFSDLEVVTDSLARFLDERDDQISIVAHSFGDWITRAALRKTNHRQFGRLVSVCPVTTAVPIVRRTRMVSEKLTCELAVMASADRAELSFPDHIDIKRSIVWARGEVLVREEAHDDRVDRQRHVWASHNSVLFQPNGWEVIREELLRGFGTQIATSTLVTTLIAALADHFH